jgi:hypothetical protein
MVISAAPSGECCSRGVKHPPIHAKSTSGGGALTSTDDYSSARVRGFRLADEKRGELSGSGELMTRTDLDREQSGHLGLLASFGIDG